MIFTFLMVFTILSRHTINAYNSGHLPGAYVFFRVKRTWSFSTDPEVVCWVLGSLRIPGCLGESGPNFKHITCILDMIKYTLW